MTHASHVTYKKCMKVRKDVAVIFIRLKPQDARLIRKAAAKLRLPVSSYARSILMAKLQQGS